MDKDLSGARADRNMLQSLHDTQSDHTKRLTDHTKRLTDHTKRLTDHTKRLTRLETKVDEHTVALRELREGQQTVLAGVELIKVKLDTLIGDDG